MHGSPLEQIKRGLIMSKKGKYVFGIINSNTGFICGESEFAERVYAIAFNGVSAIVSDSEIVDYIYMSKEILARRLINHQKVIENVMREHSIIPMRLGTFAKDENEVTDILKRGCEVIKDIFEKINNKIEIDVVVAWSDLSSVIKEIGQEKEIKELKEQLLINPKGITADDQMKVGLMVKKALDERKEKYAHKVQESLKIISVDIRPHDLMDDKMILNSAFLIDKDKQTDFDKKIEELNAEFSEKLNFRCIGPLPPYSFYTLEIEKMQSEEVDWARKKLALNNSINKNEVKKAYRRLALLEHPDVNLDMPNVEKKFDELNKAYKILLDYCMALEQEAKDVGTEHCSVLASAGEEIKSGAILVKVRE